jgi:RNA-directed DNA polymerase
MAKRKAPDENQSETWDETPWPKLEKHVYRIQKRIYRAKQKGNTRAVQKLQKLLMKSEAARTLAVRRVAQDNQGKKTAGIDGVKAIGPQCRLKIVQMIHPRLLGNYKPRPARRVWIPKPGKEEKRPLGIPVMMDRALQALVKMALEPEWEAIFEPHSYGFRPGRSAHDALSKIHALTCRKEKYVLDADIKGCFDNINHQKLLSKMQTMPAIRHLVRGWLKAGVVDKDGGYTETVAGTPQGGVISPLLANIALHGMEKDLKAAFRCKEHIPQMIRYADDFVVFHPTEEGIIKARGIVEEWVKEIGLELKPSKTRFSHTLKPYQGNVGFDFLGFTVRQFPKGRHHSSRDSHRNILGFKVLIRPSKQAVKRHIAALKAIIRRHRSSTPETLIVELNRVIKGWTNYHRTQASSAVFTRCEHILWWQLARWIRWKHHQVPWKVVKKKYWKDGKFTVSEKYRLHMHSETPIVRHTVVSGDRSPYDGDMAYWSGRLTRHPMFTTSKGRLLKKCKGKCFFCGLHFKDGDILEVDNYFPPELGGKDTLDNKVILHRHCREKRQAEFEENRQKTRRSQNSIQIEGQAAQMDGTQDKSPVVEEPDAAKVARPVLK